MLNIRGPSDIDLQTPSFRVLSGVFQGLNEVLRQVTLLHRSNSFITKHERYPERAFKRNQEKQVAFLSQCLQYPAGFLAIKFPLFNQLAMLSFQMLFDLFPQPI